MQGVKSQGPLLAGQERQMFQQQQKGQQQQEQEQEQEQPLKLQSDYIAACISNGFRNLLGIGVHNQFCRMLGHGCLRVNQSFRH